MIMSDESHKATMPTSTGLLGDAPSNADSAVMYSKAGPFILKRNKDYTQTCDHCKMKDHMKNNCYNVVGYLLDILQIQGILVMC